MVILILFVLLVLLRKRRTKLKTEPDLQCNPMGGGQSPSLASTASILSLNHAFPSTTVCGLIGIGCPLISLNPASWYIAVSSLRVYASPDGVDASIVSANP